jgi:hypothetical protein
VETDGDTYHANPVKGAVDNERNNELTEYGWRVLRFNTAHVLREMPSCLETVSATVDRLGGLETEILTPRKFVRTKSGVASQFSLFSGIDDDS